MSRGVLDAEGNETAMGMLTDAYLASQGITASNPAVGLQPEDVIETDD